MGSGSVISAQTEAGNVDSRCFIFFPSQRLHRGSRQVQGFDGSVIEVRKNLCQYLTDILPVADQVSFDGTVGMACHRNGL